MRQLLSLKPRPDAAFLHVFSSTLMQSRNSCKLLVFLFELATISVTLLKFDVTRGIAHAAGNIDCFIVESLLRTGIG
jgi:hypothetical protein